jgi:hypothetical protein
MNTINAGNPSANNMLTRQVMQKKRESSATIFDKLNKRTAQLTAQNPLNNILTNDQLFRYYIKEVEPRLSQSNDNFQGLPNTTPQTPPDNSIKDTVEKDFTSGNNAGFSGNGVGGILNSNDITGYIDPNQFNVDGWLNDWQLLNRVEQKDALQDLYDNHRKKFDLVIDFHLRSNGEDVNDENRIRFIHGIINSGMLEDKYENVNESRYTVRIEEYEEIGTFLESLDTNDYGQQAAIMLNVFISDDENLDKSKFFYNLFNQFYGETTLDKAIKDLYDIWTKSKGTPLEEKITDTLNSVFQQKQIHSYNFDEFRDLVWNFKDQHVSYSAMPVKKFNTELSKYQLNKIMPIDAVQNKIDYYKEELKQSREIHARQVRDYRDLEGNDDQQNNQEIFAGQYQEDIRGNLHRVSQLTKGGIHFQLKDPSTHPSKPQELKNPATYPSAPVSAQSVKNDAVISRSSPSFVSHYVNLKPKK